MEIKEEDRKEWYALNSSGKFEEAQEFYYNKLFPAVLDTFEARFTRTVEKTDVLFSVLGFTPEPILLTQRVLRPKTHIIFFTEKDKGANEKIFECIKRCSIVEYTLVELSSEQFDGIYDTLKEQMLLHPAQHYAIDISGGKKSMVASAAIFGRDYNFNILYVDFDKYDPALRRPVPGYERLNCVYSPSKNLPEIYHSEPYKKEINRKDDRSFDLQKYIRNKRCKRIKDINYWWAYGFDTAKEVFEYQGSYYAIWDK